MKYILPIIMSLVFIGILVGANFYLSRRIAWAFSLDNVKWLHLLFGLIPVYMIAGLIGFSNATTTIGSLLYGLAAILTGLMLYFVLSMLLTDLFHLLHEL